MALKLRVLSILEAHPLGRSYAGIIQDIAGGMNLQVMQEVTPFLTNLVRLGLAERVIDAANNVWVYVLCHTGDEVRCAILFGEC